MLSAIEKRNASEDSEAAIDQPPGNGDAANVTRDKSERNCSSTDD
jgi:hypothetical protein